MYRFPTIVASFCLGIFAFIMASVIILSLIPVYLPSSNLVASNRTRLFVYTLNGSFASGRALNPVTVDTTSLPTIQQTIQSLLIEWNLPQSVVANVNETDVDFNYGILHVVGSYIFRSFCSQACQNSILNQLPDSEIQLQTPITIQIRVNGVAYTYTFWAINFNALTTGTTEEIELTYYMTPNTATRRRRLRRQIVNSANNQPIISLVNQTLSLSSSVENIPFTIENSTWIDTNESIQLNVFIQLQFPGNCLQSCREQSIDDFFTTVVDIYQIGNLNYTNGSVSYQIEMIYPLIISSPAPPSLQTLTYDLSNSNSSDITPGPITDLDSWENLTIAIYEAYINSPVYFEVESAFFEPESTSRSFGLPQTYRIRRQFSSRYALVVVIKFPSFDCNYPCQQEILESTISYISMAPPPQVSINGITFYLPQPTIGPLQIPAQPFTITTTAAVVNSTTTPPSTTITVVNDTETTTNDY